MRGSSLRRPEHHSHPFFQRPSLLPRASLPNKQNKLLSLYFKMYTPILIAALLAILPLTLATPLSQPQAPGAVPPPALTTFENGTITGAEGTAILARPSPDLNQCGIQGGGLFSKADIADLSHALQTDEPWKTEHLGPLHWISWVRGTARVCITNPYWFKSTDVQHWEVGWVMGWISGQCCTTQGNPQW